MTPTDSRDHFSHFRRYLLGSSSLLAVLGGADIRLELLPSLDDSVLVGRAWVLYGVLWLFVAYAVYGCVFYFRNERQAAFAAGLSDAKREGVRHYLHRLGERKGWSAHRTEASGEVSVWPMDIEVEIYRHFEPEPQARASGKPAQNVVEQGFVRINRALWSLLVVRSVAARLLLGPAFFQYVLPVLWLVAAVALANAGHWTGSLESLWTSAWADVQPTEVRPEVFQQTMCDWRQPDRRH